MHMAIHLTVHKMSEAARFNKAKGRRVGWVQHYDRVLSALGMEAFEISSAVGFAMVVAQWQVEQGLTGDGMLGRHTWKKMLAETEKRRGASIAPAWFHKPIMTPEPIAAADWIKVALED